MGQGEYVEAGGRLRSHGAQGTAHGSPEPSSRRRATALPRRRSTMRSCGLTVAPTPSEFGSTLARVFSGRPEPRAVVLSQDTASVSGYACLPRLRAKTALPSRAERRHDDRELALIRPFMRDDLKQLASAGEPSAPSPLVTGTSGSTLRGPVGYSEERRRSHRTVSRRRQ